jgi:hypothetical protein
MFVSCIPIVKIFDLLYLNGMSLTHRSLKFRKKNLKSCVSPIKGRIELVAEFEGKTAQDVRKRMEEIMADRGEGLVIKHPESEYVLNGRNKDWIKVCGSKLCGSEGNDVVFRSNQSIWCVVFISPRCDAHSVVGQSRRDCRCSGRWFVLLPELNL